MKIQVTTLYHDVENSGELTVHPNEDAATDAKYELTLSSWDNVFCLDGEDCDVPGCHGVPRDPSVLERDTAIDAYFSHRKEFEYAAIVTHEIEVPLVSLLGDWVNRAQHEVDRSYTEPRTLSACRALIEELLALDTPHAA